MSSFNVSGDHLCAVFVVVVCGGIVVPYRCVIIAHKQQNKVQTHTQAYTTNTQNPHKQTHSNSQSVWFSVFFCCPDDNRRGSMVDG